MKKRLFFFLITFVAGFLTHALIFPDVLNNGIVFFPPIENSATGTPQPTLEPSTTLITYNGTFSRHNITIPFSRYLIIRNDSTDVQMTLSSTLADLATPRPYGQTEQIRSRMDKKGQFQVWDTNNPSEKLIITIK